MSLKLYIYIKKKVFILKYALNKKKWVEIDSKDHVSLRNQIWNNSVDKVRNYTDPSFWASNFKFIFQFIFPHIDSFLAVAQKLLDWMSWNFA